MRDISSRALVYAVALGAVASALLVICLIAGGGLSAVQTYINGRSEELDAVLDGAPLYLWWASLASIPAAVLCIGLAVRKPSPTSIICTALVMGAALFRTIPTGNRGALLMLVGSALVLAYLRAGRRPRPGSVALLLVVGLVVSYSVLLVRYEGERSSPGEIIEIVAEAPGRVFAPVTRGADAEMAPALAGALLVIPSELGYRFGGATIGDLALRPVPRHLWEGKPRPHTDVITGRVWPVAQERGGFQPNFTPLLSFYWDFGLIGVVLGMALYGVLARWAYESYVVQSAGFVAHTCYALVLISTVVAVRGDPVQTSLHLLIMLAPIVLLARLAPVRESG